MMYRSTFLIFSLFLISSLRSQPVEDAASSTSEQKLSSSINRFGCNLLHSLYEEAGHEDNILVSPVNAYTGLALLHLGAGEKTRKELEGVMKLKDDVKDVHEQLHAVISKLSSKKDVDPREKFHETILANALFLQDGFPVKDTYLAAVKKYYDSSAKTVDFSGKSQETTDLINSWISESTKGRIAKFYDSPIPAETVAVLTSALYFNAQWKNSFQKENTQKEKFNTGAKEIEVPMMNSNSSIEFTRDNTLHYDSVSLPYSGREFVMNIYLQHTEHGDHGSLAHLFHQLAQQNFASNSSRQLVNLKLPKMKFSWKKSIVENLKLKDIFSQPDLSALTEKNQLKISDMKHATELEVDEKGTIATATTALEAVLYSLFVPPNPEPIEFHVNRPFLMTIEHQPSKTTLFAGIIRKPI